MTQTMQTMTQQTMTQQTMTQSCPFTKTMRSGKKFLCDLCEKQLDSALLLSQHKHCAHPSLILPNLYLGAEDDAESKSVLDKLKIARILNVAGDAKCYYPDDFDYLHLPLDDEPEQILRPHFQKAFEYIEEGLRLGEAVLVHCVLGISRSASFIIAYLMKTRRWSFKESMQFVKERRRFIFPNEGFIKQLGEFEAELSKKGGCKPCSTSFLSLRTISLACPSSPSTGTQLSRSHSAPHLPAHGTTKTNTPLRSSASTMSSSVPQKSTVPLPVSDPHSPVSSASTTSNESEDDKTCHGFDFWVSPPSPRPSDPETEPAEPGDDPLSASTSSIEDECSFVFDSNYDGSELGGGGGGGSGGGSGFSPEEAVAAKCAAFSAKKKRASKKKKKQRRQQLRAR